MQANIYSLEPLASPLREAVHDGLGLVAAYIGETVASKDLQVRLPVTPEGLVDPKRIGYRNFDKMVELHLLAVPLAGSSERLGLSLSERGVSYVGMKTNNTSLIRATAAHEVAHSLGFVLEGAGHADPTNTAHCADASCIMHYRIATIMDTVETEVKQGFVGRMLGRPSERQRTVVERLLHSQYDFCRDCKADLWGKGQDQLSRLRLDRLMGSKRI